MNFQLQDYRQHHGMTEVVSVMLEHVGKAAYRKFFACVDRALNNPGIALIHTIADQQRAGAVNPWIRQHIFPGGHILCRTSQTAIEQSRLVIADLECWRGHYALTLQSGTGVFRTTGSDLPAARRGVLPHVGVLLGALSNGIEVAILQSITGSCARTQRQFPSTAITCMPTEG